MVFHFGFYWTAPGLGGPHPTCRGLCCCVLFPPHLWWLYVPKFLREMISWEDKVSQALCFGGQASHSPFLMWRLFKDFCSSYLNIGLPSLESCLHSHQEEVRPMGGESVEKMWEGHALLCFFPGGKHLFSASLGTCSLLHYLGLWDCHSYSQRAVCRLELDFGLGGKRWCLALQLLSPILHQLYSYSPAQWPLLGKEPLLGDLRAFGLWYDTDILMPTHVPWGEERLSWAPPN